MFEMEWQGWHMTLTPPPDTEFDEIDQTAELADKLLKQFILFFGGPSTLPLELRRLLWYQLTEQFAALGGLLKIIIDTSDPENFHNLN